MTITTSDADTEKHAAWPAALSGTEAAEIDVAGPWRYERLDGPGHWLQLDAPDQVNTLLLDFLPR